LPGQFGPESGGQHLHNIQQLAAFLLMKAQMKICL